MKKLFRDLRRMLIAAGTALSVYASPAPAVLLNSGDYAALTGTTTAIHPELAGTVLADTLRPFAISLEGGQLVTGTVQDRVVRSDVDGTLIFYYRIFNDASSAGAIESFASGGYSVTPSGYAGFSTDVDFITDSVGTVAPYLASRHYTSGAEIDFHFDIIEPGVGSQFLFIKTDATQYNDAGHGLIVGNGFSTDPLLPSVGFFSGAINLYQPVVVPLPSAVWLFGSGLLGLISVAKRKKNA